MKNRHNWIALTNLLSLVDQEEESVLAHISASPLTDISKLVDGDLFVRLDAVKELFNEGFLTFKNDKNQRAVLVFARQHHLTDYLPDNLREIHLSQSSTNCRGH